MNKSNKKMYMHWYKNSETAKESCEFKYEKCGNMCKTNKIYGQYMYFFISSYFINSLISNVFERPPNIRMISNAPVQ